MHEIIIQVPEWFCIWQGAMRTLLEIYAHWDMCTGPLWVEVTVYSGQNVWGTFSEKMQFSAQKNYLQLLLGKQ